MSTTTDSRRFPLLCTSSVIALIAASDGRAGGERAMHSLILCMMPFRARLIYGPEVFVGHCREAFDAEGRVQDARAEKNLGLLMKRLRSVLEE